MKKSEKSPLQLDYESALSFINSKGFDVETNLIRGNPQMVHITVMKDNAKFLDSKGVDRVKIIPFDKDFLKKVAESVINLAIFLKSK